MCRVWNGIHCKRILHQRSDKRNCSPCICQITISHCTQKFSLPQDEDVFVCSIGDKQRKQCIEKIQGRGGEFINLIHQTARFYTNAKLGKGNFIGAYTVIGNDAQIGDFNMIQSYTVIGHDDKIGNWNRIDTHVTCVGGIIIEDHVNIHTSAVISHNVVVESEANVGACSFVIRRVKSGTTVFGNPAKKLV